MRLLIVDHKTVWGGGQVALVNVLREWERTSAAIEPTVVCPPAAELVPRVRALGIACETFDLGAIEKTRGAAWNLGQRLAPTRQLLSVMRRTRTEVVLANGAFSFLASVAAAKIARVPIVWWEHNASLPGDARLKQMIGWASRIVVVSEAIHAQFAVLVPEAQAKLTVIYNGVDGTVFRRMRGASGQVVGTVSRLSEEKGIAYLVDAVPEILRELPAAQFMIVGDGPLRRELEGRASSNTIRFVGAQADVATWLNQMDVFVMPSLTEAFGIAVVEAMACELPVVASDVGGLREVVAPNETGVLVPPRDARAIARAVIELLGDEPKRRSMGRAGRKRMEEHFTLERQAGALSEALRGTMKRPPDN